MADSALFVGWGDTKPGLERKAIELFKESLVYMSKLVSEGRVDSIEPFFLEPHGGDLEGFWVLRGETEKLSQLRIDDDFQHYTVRAQAVVNGFRVIGATSGERLNQHMAWFAEAAMNVTSD